MTSSSAPLRWRASSQAVVLGATSALAAALALGLRRPELLALATPGLWTLLTTVRGPEAASVTVRVPAALRLQEGETAPIALEVDGPAGAAHVRAALVLPEQLSGEVLAAGSELTVESEVGARRWGRHRLGPVRLTALDDLGLRRADTDVAVEAHALVLPAPVVLRSSSAPAVLPDRVGEHVSRLAGAGVEPVGVRPWASGDEARRIDWRATSRRGGLHVTVAAAERSVDLVVVVDALSDVGRAGVSSLDRAVRAAAGIADRWLRDRDRVGLVVLGGSLRWLTPAAGASQQLRVAEAVLQAQLPPGDIAPDLRRVPPQVVPAGSVVVVLSPLLHPAALDAVVGLRGRSRRVVVVDVLGGAEPLVDPRDTAAGLALRLWRLERRATLDRLRRTGTPVLSSPDEALDRAIATSLRALR